MEIDSCKKYVFCIQIIRTTNMIKIRYYGTATFVPGKGAAFYGGFEE